MVCEVEGVFFIETDSDDVSLPADSFVVVFTVKLLYRLLGIVQKTLVPAVFAEFTPSDVGYRLYSKLLFNKY